MGREPKTRVAVVGGKVTEYHDFSVMGPVYREFLEAAGYSTVTTDDLSIIEPRNIGGFDVVVLATTGGTLSDSRFEGLKLASGRESGRTRGIVALHGAAASFMDRSDYHRLIGGKFLTHPPLGPAFHFTVEDKNHPVTAGIDDFDMVDELYLMETYPPLNVLISSEYEGQSRPVLWVRPPDAGRICYCSLGHDIPQITHPVFQRIVINAIEWAAADKIQPLR